MPTFDNLKEMDKYLKNVAKEAMVKGKAVKETVIEEGKKSVDDIVYSYKPRQYDRTGELRESWKVEEIVDGIAVFNDRKDGSKNIAEVIESGEGYDFTGYGYEYEEPRQFIENTRQQFSKGNKLTDSLKKDLKAYGLDVE